jgi:DNA-binding MarR family transcriptional regulator
MGKQTLLAEGILDMEFKEIIYEKAEGIAKITINRPQRYNFFTALTLEEMFLAIRDAWADKSVGVAILTGAGEKAFCTGGDQKTKDDEGYGKGEASFELLEAHGRLLNIIRAFPQPIEVHACHRVIIKLFCRPDLTQHLSHGVELMLFEDCICFRLGALSRKITRTYKDSLASIGLTHGQFFLLIALYEENGLLPSRLADKVSLDRPTTTGLLDRLERDGWIERRFDLSDRRTVRVYLTPKALEQRSDILNTYEKINGHYLEKYSNEEWLLLHSLLERLDEDKATATGTDG